MTTIINLPEDLIEEIFSILPTKSMRESRLTCKTLNTLSQSPISAKLRLGKKRSSSGKRREKKVSQIFNCEGLLLCILKDDFRVVVWNPYLGQTRWIEPRYFQFREMVSYAFGYEKKESCCSYKLLRFINRYEIYDFDSDLWTTLDVTPPHWGQMFGGVSLKGNTYFRASERGRGRGFRVVEHIICFEFTSQRFGPLLPLPFSIWDDESVSLSFVSEENLAVLRQFYESSSYELCITTEIEAEKASWSKFLRVKTDFSDDPFMSGSYFIDEEKKVTICFDGRSYHRVYIIGDDGYFRTLDVGEPAGRNCMRDWCVYVPSLAQIKQRAGGEMKQESDLEKCRHNQNKSRLAAFEKQVKQEHDERKKTKPHEGI